MEEEEVEVEEVVVVEEMEEVEEVEEDWGCGVSREGEVDYLYRSHGDH